jgi:phosphinothricin acetyltransferase
MTGQTFVECTLEAHGEGILAILNEAIVNSTALYDYHPRPSESMLGWFEAKAAGGFPVIGIQDDAGELLGFATYGSFRPHPAYKYAVEHSVYVRADQRGKGLGRKLLARVIELAKAQGKHAMIGAIDASNSASIALHESMGFERVGTLPQVGFKFGRWLDLALMQLTFETPRDPIDG